MPDNVEIQGLEFQIIGDSVDATQSLDKLKETLVNLKTAVKGGVSGIRTTARQIEALKTSLSGFDTAKVQALKDIAGGLTALGAVGKVRISSTIPNQITALKTSLDGLDTSSTGKLIDLAAALKPLSEIGRAHLTPLINQLGKLPDLIRELDKVDLTKFTHQMEYLAAALKPFADEMAKIASGFSAFPSRIQKVITSTEQYNNTVKKATTRTNLWAKAMKALSWGSILMGLRRVASFITDCIYSSMEYTENLNLFTVAMGEYADEAQAYAEKVSAAMGIDTSEWMRAQGVFQTLLTGFGNVADRAYIMSTNLTQLGYDLASLFNMDVSEAMQKLQSGISGELEPLRRLGYDLSQARLEAVALSLGIDKAVSSMTQAEKAELRYYAIMTQVTTAQGDMARTLNSPANQLRIFKAQLEMCARSIGNVFIPALNAILPYAIAVVQVIREIADAIAESFGYELPEVDYSGIGSSVGTLTSEADEGAESMTDVKDSIEDTNKALKKMKQYTAGFDELNIISQNTDTSGLGDIDSAVDVNAGANTGSGFDFDLPSYDFLADAVNTQVDEIRAKMEPFVTWVKENLDWILPTVKAIGVAFLTWKITDSVLTGIEKIITHVETLKKVEKGIGKFQARFPKTSAWLAGVKTSLANAGTAISGFFASIPAAAVAGFAGILVGVPTFITGLHDALTEGLNWMNGSLVAAGATLTGAGVGAIIGSLGGPIGAGVGALIGLAVGLITDFSIWLYENWDEVCEFFRGVGESISGFFTDCWAGIQETWSVVTSWFDETIITPVSDTFNEVTEKIGQFFTNAWAKVTEVWNTVAEWFQINIIDPVSNAFKNVTDWIGTFFEGCWIIVQAVWIKATEWFQINIIDPVTTLFREVTENISQFFSDAWAGICQFFSDAWSDIKKTWNAVSSWFRTNVTEPVTKWFKETAANISEFFSDAWVKVKDTWAVVTNWFQTTIIEPVRQKFHEVTSKIGQFFSDAWAKVKNAWGVATNWFTNTIINPVVQRFQNAVQKIRSAFENAFTGIKNFVKGIFNSVIASVEGVINRVISGFNNLIGKFNNVVTWAADIVGTNWKGLKTLSLVSLPRLANGGFVDEGQLFIARERGAEMVGSMSNRTGAAVANNDQIVDGIRAGVYEAVIAAMGDTAQKGEQIIKVFLDGKQIMATVEKHQRERGVSIMGGVVYG